MPKRCSAVRGDLLVELRARGVDALITRRELAALAGCGLSAMHSWFARHAAGLQPANVPGSAHAYRVGDLLAVMAPSRADAA
jgi:hypothetical protein